MAKSPAEFIRELSLDMRSLVERDATRQRELAELKALVLNEQQERIRLQMENAALKQQLQDHVKQTEVADNRRWGCSCC